VIVKAPVIVSPVLATKVPDETSKVTQEAPSENITLEVVVLYTKEPVFPAAAGRVPVVYD
jgi:hypothetical protein